MSGSRRIKSTETAFAIVEQLRAHGEMGVTELGEQIDVSKSNIHHHLSTMQAHNFVVKRGGKYALGLEFFTIGNDTRDRFPLYDAAKQHLPELAAETGETAWCMVEENSTGVFIDGYVSRNSMNPDAVIGTRKPLHCNSAGKAILAFLPADQRERILSGDLRAMTAETITDPGRLRDELAEIRERGYSLNFEEDVSGIHAVGTPIFAGESEIVGSISVGGAANRLTEEVCVNELAPTIKAIANDIELALTYD